jgi:DNA repair exonuclease SbcCD ATPase subunit
VISALTLQNFQPHKDTTLTFDPHITAIVGSSDSGKTSILRALYWALQNKPSGTQMVSFWNRKKDGSPKGTTSVSLTAEDHTIARVRSAERNGYDWDEKELSAIGRDVPEEITSYLNLSDINISRQFDRHFLLSETSGEVARRLNELVHLDIIDEVLSKAEKLKREAKKTGEEAEAAVLAYQKKLDALSWLEGAKGLLEKRENVEKSKQKSAQDASMLSTARDNLLTHETTLNRIKCALEAGKGPVEQIYMAYLNKKTNKQQIDNLLSIKSRLGAVSLGMDAYGKARPAKRVIELFDDMERELQEVREHKGRLTEIRDALLKVDEDIAKLYIDAQTLKEQLPDTCPLCGAPLENKEAL